MRKRTNTDVDFYLRRTQTGVYLRMRGQECAGTRSKDETGVDCYLRRTQTGVYLRMRAQACAGTRKRDKTGEGCYLRKRTQIGVTTATENEDTDIQRRSRQVLTVTLMMFK